MLANGGMEAEAYSDNTQQKSVVLFTILGPWSSQNINVIILENIVILYTDKKENQFSSYIRKFRIKQCQSHIWLNICAFPHMLGSPSSYNMTLQLLHSEFPYIWEKFDFIFYQWQSSHAKRCPSIITVKKAFLFIKLSLKVLSWRNACGGRL